MNGLTLCLQVINTLCTLTMRNLLMSVLFSILGEYYDDMCRRNTVLPVNLSAEKLH